MQVVTVAEMREIERRAEAEYGLDSPTLMEHAGRSVAEHLRAALGGDVTQRNILILVGPGNNGGDGRVLGRYLAQWDAAVTYYAWKERRLEIDARLIPVNDDLAAVREAISRAEVVADALLGTGNARPLEPTMRHLLTLVREERARRPGLFVLGVDLPHRRQCRQRRGGRGDPHLRPHRHAGLPQDRPLPLPRRILCWHARSRLHRPPARNARGPARRAA